MTAPVPPDIAALQKALAAPDAATRIDAAERLCRAGSAASVAAVDLVRSCADTDDQVREWAAAALEELGSPPADAIPPLTELVGGADPLSAYWAATLLGRAGKAAATAVPVLAEHLGAADDIAVRQRIAGALGKIGPAAAAAREALTRAAADPDQRLARLATDALAALGS
jgi:HEAT repeat protein